MTLSGEQFIPLLDGYDVWSIKPHDVLHFSFFSRYDEVPMRYTLSRDIEHAPTLCRDHISELTASLTARRKGPLVDTFDVCHLSSEVDAPPVCTICQVDLRISTNA